MGSEATGFNFVSLEVNLLAEGQFIHQSRKGDKESGHWLGKADVVVEACGYCVLVSSAHRVK